tara:strand:- start:7795 stop:8094 length:300 start_codon:yes stop_codon:yes gene_type:complete
MELVIFILVCYGISNIMVFSSVFKWWRDVWVRISPNFFGELFNCMMCLPYWIGMILSLMGFSPFLHYYETEMWIAMFIDGFLASGSVWLLHTLQEKLEK